MTSVYVVTGTTTWGENQTHILKSFTTLEEAKRYKYILDNEQELDLVFEVEECGLYNKCEEINE